MYVNYKYFILMGFTDRQAVPALLLARAPHRPTPQVRHADRECHYS